MFNRIGKAASNLVFLAIVKMRGWLGFGCVIQHKYKMRCFAYEGGPLLWETDFKNLVTTAGLNKYLDACLKTGLASPAWFVGLVTAKTSGYNAADTVASHSGWTEGTPYSNTYRPTWTPGSISAGSVDNSASPATFTINGSATILGAFMADEHTPGGSTGTLLGVGDLGASQPVISGNSLQIVVVSSMTSA